MCLPLNHLMGEMLADVDVLGTLTSADHVVSPFDARRVVLVYLGIGLLGEAHVGQQVAEVYDLDRHLGCCVVFCFGSRQRDFLLQDFQKMRPLL